MTTRAEFILSQHHLRKDLHPGTILFFEWTLDHARYMVPKVSYNIGGVYFRHRVVDVDAMACSAEFFNRNIPGLKNTYDAFEAASLPHDDYDSTREYAFSIDKHVRYFVDIAGSTELLPYHPKQRFYFQVRPMNMWSETATAVYYQHFRAGYFNSQPGRHLVKTLGKRHIECSYGILERAHDTDKYDVRVSLVIPQTRCIDEVERTRPLPTLVWHEAEGPNKVHYPPSEAELKQLYGARV